MPEKNDVSVYMRFVVLEVVIPREYVWKFMEDFGWAFASEAYEGGKTFKSVEGCLEHPNGWHVSVKIFDTEEDRFMAFLKNFCLQNGLVSRGSRA